MRDAMSGVLDFACSYCDFSWHFFAAQSFANSRFVVVLEFTLCFILVDRVCSARAHRLIFLAAKRSIYSTRPPRCTMHSTASTQKISINRAKSNANWTRVNAITRCTHQTPMHDRVRKLNSAFFIRRAKICIFSEP